ncbi:Uncharacterized conserved protein, contains GH25 family domain [Pustulibacterium marinum]|uniref:Uncharacterized conserved protein, contains GH25 family domain n=1 Tax=Pustulibacterium marinum TaxID=1224947 RepID=A0A1I7HUP8_9FLAO|nr:DUF4198 domain-containing protein [Pustulibacterium marinum]SFU64464.1 Uncharacterized conserved protein, contains GH25 family domain [Pustulibacterium marinum]
MKTFFLTALCCFFYATSFAHFLWIETEATGKLNTKHTVNVYYGEYSYGVKETVGGDTFNKVKNFSLWAIAPDGSKTALEISAKENFYTAQFTPTQKGTYTIALNNNDIEVIDFTKYDFGIFKTHYYSSATVTVGKIQPASVTQNENGIALQLVKKEGNQATFKLLYKNEALAKSEVTIFMQDQWSKKINTDDNGLFTFAMPFDTTYVLEATTKEEVPGEFKGKTYEFVWHCSTFSIK